MGKAFAEHGERVSDYVYDWATVLQADGKLKLKPATWLVQHIRFPKEANLGLIKVAKDSYYKQHKGKRLPVVKSMKGLRKDMQTHMTVGRMLGHENVIPSLEAYACIAVACQYADDRNYVLPRFLPRFADANRDTEVGYPAAPHADPLDFSLSKDEFMRNAKAYLDGKRAHLRRAMVSHKQATKDHEAHKRHLNAKYFNLTQKITLETEKLESVKKTRDGLMKDVVENAKKDVKYRPKGWSVVPEAITHFNMNIDKIEREIQGYKDELMKLAALDEEKEVAGGLVSGLATEINNFRRVRGMKK